MAAFHPFGSKFASPARSPLSILQHGLTVGLARPRRCFACPIFTLCLRHEETNPFSSSSLLHLQPPLAGVKGGERRGIPDWCWYWHGEEVQLLFQLMGSGGKSCTLLLVWVMDFFPQALLQSATHSLSTEDTADFTHDRYAYAYIYMHEKLIQ